MKGLNNMNIKQKVGLGIITPLFAYAIGHTAINKINSNNNKAQTETVNLEDALKKESNMQASIFKAEQELAESQKKILGILKNNFGNNTTSDTIAANLTQQTDNTKLKKTALEGVFYDESTKTHYNIINGYKFEYRPIGLGNGQKVVIVYADGRFEAENIPDGKTNICRYLYNKEGQVICFLKGKDSNIFIKTGGAIVTEYDESGKTTIHYDNNDKPEFSYRYDTDNRITEIQSHKKGITQTYNYLSDGYIETTTHNKGRASYSRYVTDKHGDVVDSYPCDVNGNKLPEIYEGIETELEGVYYDKTTRTHYIIQDNQRIEYRPKNLNAGEKVVIVGADGSYVTENIPDGENYINRRLYNKEGLISYELYGKDKNKFVKTGEKAVTKYTEKGSIKTEYNSNNTARITFTYDKYGNTTKIRNHEKGITITYTTVADGKIEVVTYDSGKAFYYKHEEDGNGNEINVYSCDKNGN